MCRDERHGDPPCALFCLPRPLRHCSGHGNHRRGGVFWGLLQLLLQAGYRVGVVESQLARWYGGEEEERVEFLVLGRLEVRRDGRPIRIGAGKQRGLLALLLLNANHAVSRDRLIDELWGAEAPPTVSTQLRVRLAELRQLLEPGRESRAPGEVLVSQDGGYLIRVESDELDMLRFERLLGEASSRLEAEEPEAAAEELRGALALWRGSALEDFTYEPFAQATIARLEELRLVALERRMEADLSLGRHEDLVPELEGLIASHRHRERLRAHLMLALYRAGRQGDALAAFQNARRTLDEELGIEPSPALRELEQAVLQQDLSLTLPGESRAEPQARTELRNPYKGLRPFAADDVGDFFGRDALIDELAQRLEQGARFLCVLGASGSGKSSAVSAGLVPRLRGGEVAGLGDATIVEVMPGPEPLIELEAALLRVAHNPPASLIEQLEGHPNGLRRAIERVLPENGGELVLVIDQFEELFTLVADEHMRAHVLESILLAATAPRSRVRVVVTLRADFHDRPLRYREFGQLLQDNITTVLPLSPEEVERAIAGPAEAVGAVVDPALVAEIVADVTDQPGALPLLQYALTELFEQRDTDLLSVERYRSVGGVTGAIAARAERLYAGLEQNERDATRRLFLRLVTLGEGTEDTRRRVPRSELDPHTEASGTETVIDRYTQHRLLSTDRDPTTAQGTVEVAHEALLREWPRLKEWINNDREGHRRLRHISDAATSWNRLDRDPGELYRGARLEQALHWHQDHPDDLNPLETEFLTAAREQRDTDEQAERERLAQRIRQNKRLRIALAIVALALAGAIAGAIVALDQRGTAREQTDRAELASASADSEAARAETALADEADARTEAETARTDAEAARDDEALARFGAETGRLVAESAARVGDDRRLALLLAAEAHGRDSGVDSLGGLQRALTGSLGFLGYLGSGSDYVAVEFAGDTQLVAVSASGIETWDVARLGSSSGRRPASSSSHVLSPRASPSPATSRCSTKIACSTRSDPMTVPPPGIFGKQLRCRSHSQAPATYSVAPKARSF